MTSARIRDELKPAGLDWITALRAPQIRALLGTGAFQLSLFDERDLAEITAPRVPRRAAGGLQEPAMRTTPGASPFTKLTDLDESGMMLSFAAWWVAAEPLAFDLLFRYH
jgi:hypothetical protein